MIISLNVEKALDKSQHLFIIKSLGDSRDTRSILQYNKCNLKANL